jgi:glycosyltransferase involved in cell wall biosynthesis
MRIPLPYATASLALVIVVMPSFQPLELERGVPVAAAPRTAERPRVTVAVPELRGGRAIPVPAGADLQRAIDQAQGGDVLELAPQATYRGPFRLPRKTGDQWIVITSASRRLPASGTRVGPEDAALMPRLTSASGPIFSTEPGAHHYRFVGLHIAPEADVRLDTLVELGQDDTSVDTLPHHFVFDRCYLHGDRLRGARRGIAMNTGAIAVIDSHFADFKDTHADSQAVVAWNGTGPFLVSNNHLEAAGESIMFGGGDPTISGLVPADIEIRRNHIVKPLRWKAGHDGYEGTEWAVKNLVELKNARRVLIDGNVIEHNWPQAQNGFAILFTVRNQDGDAPWSTIEDISFVNNVVRHVGAGINLLGRDDNHHSGQLRRVVIRNNVFSDVGGQWGHGRLFQLLNGTDGVVIDHNTACQTGGILFADNPAPHTGFVFQNNVVRHNAHGISGSGTSTGRTTLGRYFPNAVVRRNVFIGGDPDGYPTDNFFPAPGVVGIDALCAGAVAAVLPPAYRRAGTDGADPGAAVAAMVPVSTGLTIPAGAGGGGFPLTAVAFWLSLAALGYIYAGYPLLVWLRARHRPAPHTRAPIEPSVSILVIANNEEDRIGARIANLLALDYPADRLEIVVASDGSTDGTVERAAAFESAAVESPATFESPNVRVRQFDTRRGKAAVLNAVTPTLRGEILVLADARQLFSTGTLRALVANFADPAVGAASGKLMLTADGSLEAAGSGCAFYWRYETFIRSMEARRDSTVGATGAIYAIRRRLFERLPEDTVLDDVVVPIRIAAKGYRVVFEPDAVAYDRAAGTARQELSRKIRTIAGNFQLFSREPWLLAPWRNRLWFQTVSHKGLRLLLPLFHGAAMAGAIALADDAIYRLAVIAQVAFYGAALAGLTERGARRVPGVSVATAMTLLCWATIAGFVRFATGRQSAAWERSPMPSVSAPAVQASHARSARLLQWPKPATRAALSTQAALRSRRHSRA